LAAPDNFEHSSSLIHSDGSFDNRLIQYKTP